MGSLLLLDLNGARFGVREDEVTSLRGALTLHRLPLSPPAIAGIAILDDRSAVLADLGACLGLPPLTKPQEGTLLIIDTQDKIAGFCVEGAHERIECPPELVLPLPSAVATPVADTCMVRGGQLVPIINIRALHDRLKRGRLELPSPEPGQQVRAMDLSDVRAVRMFSIGGFWFCVDAEGSEYAAVNESGMARLPVRSRRIAGIVLHDEAVVPVILPGERLAAGGGADGTGMLLARIEGVQYGIVVDKDLGVVAGQDLSILALPDLVRRPWLPAAVLGKGKLSLLVDFDLFVAPEVDNADEESAPELKLPAASCRESSIPKEVCYSHRPLTPQQAARHALAPGFTPASPFPAKFLKEDVEVVEFSLLGARHAVPKDEVKEVHAMLPFIPVPGAPEIVLGVAELRGELLLVLDLATVFGRRSLAGNKGRMIRIINGDFHALVVTKEVAGDRRLPVDAQRQLPIALPHRVLYGCYLDAGTVTLILNVEALAVHFEKAAVRELVASLSPELTEIGAPGKTPLAPGVADQLFPMEPAGQKETIPFVSPAKAGDAEEEREQEIMAAAAAVEQEVRLEEAARLRSAAEAAAREQARQRIEAAKRRAEDEVRSRAAEQARLAAEAEAKAREEQRRHEEAERIRSETEARAKAEEEEKAREQESALRKAAEEAASRAAEEARRRQEEEAAQQKAEQARIAAGAAMQEAEESGERGEREAAVTSGTTPVAAAASPAPAVPSYGDQQPASRKKGKHRGAAALIAAILVLIIYITGSPVKQMAPPVPEKAQPQSVQKPSPPRDGTQQAKQATPEDVLKGLPRPETLAPLYLTVPPDRVVPEQTVYIVVKGDTLWGIAKRFTGNPLNYPRVAKDSSIATPDLIFPGQRIRLVQNKR